MGRKKGKSTKEPVPFECVIWGSIVMRIYAPTKEVKCFPCSHRLSSSNYVEKNRLLINEKNKERQKKNLENGKCRCGNKPIDVLKYCEKCRERFLTRKKTGVENGLCSYCCKRTPIEGRAMCEQCTERQRLAKVKSRNKLSRQAMQV